MRIRRRLISSGPAPEEAQVQEEVAPAAAPAPIRRRVVGSTVTMPEPAKPSRPRPVGRTTLTDLEAGIMAAKEYSRSQDWSDAKPRDIVGLYAMCHEAVYGVEPEELKQRAEMRAAVGMASRLLRNCFDDEIAELIDFMRWVWAKEKKKIDWMKEKNYPVVKRIGYRLQFSAGLVTDYRVAQRNKGIDQ